jgi:hypothetical protein
LKSATRRMQRLGRDPWAEALSLRQKLGAATLKAVRAL